jgi:Ca2+-binding EF-hand superfamily protein
MEDVNNEVTKPKPDTSRQAEIAFRLYDKDKDGYITKNEMEKLSKNLSKEQIDKVFARFDADGDGKLSYAEFRKMMNK